MAATRALSLCAQFERSPGCTRQLAIYYAGGVRHNPALGTAWAVPASIVQLAGFATIVGANVVYVLLKYRTVKVSKVLDNTKLSPLQRRNSSTMPEAVALTLFQESPQWFRPGSALAEVSTAARRLSQRRNPDVTRKPPPARVVSSPAARGLPVEKV